MEHVIEFWHGENVLGRWTSPEPFWPLPSVGDEVSVEFDQPDSELPSLWRVDARRLLLFVEESGVRTVQVKCVPATDKRLIFG
jgi:hypothetical protein